MALCRRISYLYALALLTVYALFLPLGGYERMMEGKYRAFLLLSLGYVLAMTALGAWRAVRWREPMCLAALAYLALTALSAALSPYGTAVLLGGTRRDGLLTAALYAAVFLLLARHLRPDRRLLYAAAASAALKMCRMARLETTRSPPTFSDGAVSETRTVTGQRLVRRMPQPPTSQRVPFSMTRRSPPGPERQKSPATSRRTESG